MCNLHNIPQVDNLFFHYLHWVILVYTEQFTIIRTQIY